MQIKEIPIGSEVMTEYVLKESEEKPAPAGTADTKPKPKPKIEQKNLVLEDFPRLYYNEDLIEANGKKYPFVISNEFKSLQSQSIELLPEPYKFPERFRKFAEKVLEVKGGFGTPRVGIADLQFDGQRARLTARHVSYLEFIATNMSQDAFLNQFDSSFAEGETLRDYEIKNGRAVDLKDSNLSNMLGVGFIIMDKNEGYFIFGQRKKGMVVCGGTIGIVGGTPNWSAWWKTPREIYFPGALQAHFQEELGEELCLHDDEYKFVRGYWMKEFTRAPDIFGVFKTYVPMEEIVERCLQSEQAKEEHTSLFKVPRGAIGPLSSGKFDYNINNSSQLVNYLTSR